MNLFKKNYVYSLYIFRIHYLFNILKYNFFIISKSREEVYNYECDVTL